MALAAPSCCPECSGAELIPVFGEFKRAFDPDGRMNPGSIVQPHPLDSHLKLGPNYRPLQIPTHFDFSADGGLVGAALRCVGVGKCRKTDAGTMCPSYMATREELHSTRGRARVLFEALNGALPGGFTDDAMHDALDLCLSCKSCKTECPAAVDMAMYKAEFLSHYHQQHRRPLIAHALGRINEWAALASHAPGLVNSLSRSFLARPMKRALGIHPKRDLPRFAKQTFRAWFGARNGAADSRPEVVLFPDTFNNFFEPEVAIAGARVLESAGFRVTIPAVADLLWPSALRPGNAGRRQSSACGKRCACSARTSSAECRSWGSSPDASSPSATNCRSFSPATRSAQALGEGHVHAR